MRADIEIAGIQVPQADWEATPASIRALVLVLSERLQQQDERIRQLEERLNQNSKNSSKPPSADGFGPSCRPPKTVKKRPPQEPSKPPLVKCVSSSRAPLVTRFRRCCHRSAQTVVHRSTGMTATLIVINS